MDTILRKFFPMNWSTRSNERSPLFFYARHVVPLKNPTGRPASHFAYVNQGHSPEKGI